MKEYNWLAELLADVKTHAVQTSAEDLGLQVVKAAAVALGELPEGPHSETLRHLAAGSDEASLLIGSGRYGPGFQAH